MLDINIKVEAIWHVIIEPDYEIKNKPPFPPKIRVYIKIPNAKYVILEPLNFNDPVIDKVNYRTGYLAGQAFGFFIRYDPDKNPYTQIARNVRNLNRKYHLNIDEDYRIISIKNLYTYGYFKEGNNVDVKNIEKITLSKEYIEERVLNHVR